LDRRSVELDNEAVALFRGFRAQAGGPFVIESKRNPRENAPAGWYRCEETIKALSVEEERVED
jgi:hypothetical protein